MTENIEIHYLTLEEVLALPAYPTADIFPMLPEDGAGEGLTAVAFAEQVRAEGIREPLVVWNGQLVDGRQRREAAKRAGLEKVPVRYAEFADETEADSWVLSINVDRRNMNKDQLACLAVRYWEIESQRSKARSLSNINNVSTGIEVKVSQSEETGRTREILSNRFHVSAAYVQKARALYLNDRAKFDVAASGKQKVLGKMLNPGQNIKAPADPTELAIQQANDAANKFMAAITILAKSNSDTAAAKWPISRRKSVLMAKLDRMVCHFAQEFDANAGEALGELPGQECNDSCKQAIGWECVCACNRKNHGIETVRYDEPTW